VEPPDRLVALILILLSLGLYAWWVVNITKVYGSPLEAIVEPLGIEERLPIISGNTLMSLGAVRQLEFKSLGSFWVTGYSSTPEECDDTPFITASNTQVRDGVIACPRYLEFGTYISIDGKTYICEDRMSTKYPHRFDIWFPNKWSAQAFGIQLKEIIKYD